MILKKYKDDKLYLQINKFKVDDDIEHLFSTRVGWNQKNLLEDLSDILNVEEDKVYTVNQVHGTCVETIIDLDIEDISKKQRDGLITNEKGIVLVTYHADCVPIYFYDKIKKVIGIAHSGWKGTLNNISKKMIDVFEHDFDSNLDDIVVAIGPSIGLCCYEIGHDVEFLFKEKFSNEDNIILYKDETIYLDLWKVNKSNLLNRGIKDENIMESNFCTSCNTDILYSYRKENTRDRMIGAITLKP